MDREVKENYQVVIQAKDMAGQMGGLSGTTTVSITLSDVNDSPPRFANRKSPQLPMLRRTDISNEIWKQSISEFGGFTPSALIFSNPQTSFIFD